MILYIARNSKINPKYKNKTQIKYHIIINTPLTETSSLPPPDGSQLNNDN